jgi:hypothetical protein
MFYLADDLTQGSPPPSEAMPEGKRAMRVMTEPTPLLLYVCWEREELYVNNVRCLTSNV